MVASGTGVRIAYKGESTHGVTPGGNFTIARAISRNINLKKATIESQESSQARQRRDVRHGFRSVEGEIQTELSIDTYNDFLLWSMGTNAWFTPTLALSSSVTLSVTGTDTFNRVTGNWISDNYRVGDWVRGVNFTNGANNGDFRVRSVTNTALQVWATLVNEPTPPGAAAVSFIGKKTVISSVGQALKTFSLEREILDLDSAGLDLWQIYRGVAINQLAVTARPDGLLAATFRLIGMTGDIDQSSATAAYDPAPTNSPLAAIDSSVYIGANQITNATQFDFTIDNQRTLFPTIGSPTSVDVYEGVAAATGSFGLLLQNVTRATDFQAESLYQAGWQLRANELGTSEFMVFNFYRVKLLSHEIDPDKNGPVVQTMNWQGLENTITDGTTTSKETMHIQRSTLT